MKHSGSRTVSLCLALITSALLGCAGSGGADSSSSAPVSTGFKMTGSSDAANVSAHPARGVMNLLLPTAVALTPPAMLDATGASVSLGQAWVAIKEVEFKTAEGHEANEVEGSEIVFRGPYVVDLLSTTPTILDTEALPRRPYRRVKLKLHRTAVLPAGAPGELMNQSIFFSATVGGNAFKFISDDNTAIEISGANPLVPASDAELLVSINLANIFKQIDLSAVTNGAVISSSNRIVTATSKCPSIDPSVRSLYACVRLGLAKHANAGRDRHHDGHLDAAEDRLH